MQSCADTKWKTGIMGWLWLLVRLRLCGYHGNGEDKLRVVEVEELGQESCVSISPFRRVVLWSNRLGWVRCA